MSDTLTPMMAQYRKIRAQLPPNTILFFRLGDFYEMFYEDAREAAQLLDIALTKRQNVPMCGVPHHAVDFYLAKLIRAGKKVAICDQLEDPAAARGIVRRDVTAIVTPGTVTQEAILPAHLHNYLAGMCRAGETFALALLDISTGGFWVEESAAPPALLEQLKRDLPRELVVPRTQSEAPPFQQVAAELGAVLTACDDWVFHYDVARERLVRHFGVHSLEGFGCEGRPAAVGAAGALLYYVQEELHRAVPHVRGLRLSSAQGFLALDEATRLNLGLVPGRGEERAGTGTLLGLLDTTRTPMGSRLLREWLLRPLAELEGIRRRHDAVEMLTRERGLLRELRERLGGIRDLERLIARLNAGTGNARDLKALGGSLTVVPEIRQRLAGAGAELLRGTGERLVPLPELVELLARALVDEPPATLRDGGMIRPGFNAELDTLRAAASEGRNWLAEYQAREQARTGIKTLKVRYNKVFGYYIEVSRGQVGNVPADYVRKQTLVGGERFITPELKAYEEKITGAQEKARALEYALFMQLRDAAVARTADIQATATALAQLDVLATLAERALTLRYNRPVMTTGDRIRIKDGRHPVIEQMPAAERFVPNDTLLDCSENQLIILTGPNMAGKSTYIRQVALIVILAQMGSFVPAVEAEIGLVDQVFTRAGASDDLTRGRSTFLVEMQETANILNNATPRSLIVLDEIGRGTSTFDGISIAWAVAEFLHNHEGAKAKTLFATHYHELTDLALTLPGVKNYNVLVSEREDEVVFLRKIVPGGADKSYGIQVARLAGLPPAVIERAKEILSNLEEGEFGEGGQPKIARQRRRPREDRRQLSLFE